MNKEHSVIIISGLGDEVGMLRGLEPIVHSVGWHDGKNEFQPKLARLVDLIDQLVEKGDAVSLVGTSAGGSAALNAFIERHDVVHRVINICGRLRTGPVHGFRSFQSKTASSPAFAQSIKLLESKESSLTDKERQRIMTVRAMFGDELVPSDTTILREAYNTRIPTPEHMFSMGMALTVFSSPLAVWKAQGISNKECARKLGRHAGTIGRELRRNSFQDTYVAIHANALARKRQWEKVHAKEPLKNSDVYEYVTEHLRDGWSPDQAPPRRGKKII